VLDRTASLDSPRLLLLPRAPSRPSSQPTRFRQPIGRPEPSRCSRAENPSIACRYLGPRSFSNGHPAGDSSALGGSRRTGWLSASTLVCTACGSLARTHRARRRCDSSCQTRRASLSQVLPRRWVSWFTPWGRAAAAGACCHVTSKRLKIACCQRGNRWTACFSLFSAPKKQHRGSPP
jgi:hypothetical protein